MANFIQNTVTGLHSAVYKATGGKIGKKLPGSKMATLLLDHVGAKSGKSRTSPLSYYEDGAEMVLVASDGGAPKHPGWFHNLKANPDTQVQIDGKKIPVRARVASDTEHARLWPLVVGAYKGYAGYQKKTERKIPLVVLTPR